MNQATTIPYKSVDIAYADMVQHVLNNGVLKENRTGVDTISCFSYSYKLDLRAGFPLLQTKEINPAAIIAENLWFLAGKDNVRSLRSMGFKFWDAWATEDGKLETAYGRYWRHYPMPDVSEGIDCPSPLNGKTTDKANGEAWAMPPYGAEPGMDRSNPFVHTYGPGLAFDQIGWLVSELVSNPNSRRLVLNAWHPANATVSKLPPCHMTTVFNVQNGRLNCHLLQRSADIALGVPFNIAGYAFLTELLARESGLEVGEFGHTLVDAHIYVNHIEGLKKQLTRTKGVGRPPHLHITPGISIDDLTMDDIKVMEYNPYPRINFEVAV